MIAVEGDAPAPAGREPREPVPAGDGDHTAWVKVDMPLAPAPLGDFLADCERLLRINPLLEFERIAREGDETLRLTGRNESNGQRFDVRVRPTGRAHPHGLVLRYEGGIKCETRFEIEPGAGGSVLTITETYAPPDEGEREAYLRGVDRSLVPWAASLRAWLLRRERWGWLPGYRWASERFWLAMTPRQRRIGWMIAWVSLLEFVVFLFVVAIFWSEVRGS